MNCASEPILNRRRPARQQKLDRVRKAAGAGACVTVSALLGALEEVRRIPGRVADGDQLPALRPEPVNLPLDLRL